MKDSEIAEKIYKLSSGELNSCKEKELNELIKNFKKGSVGIAQINPIVGDLEHNAKKIIKYITSAKNIGLDLVIFPQLSLIGNPIGDITKRYPILVENNIKWLEEIVHFATDITAIIGFIEPNTLNDSIAIIQNGKIISTVEKGKISELNCLITNGIRYKIIIGDDYQNITNINNETDVIINCCSNIAGIKNEQIKNKILPELAKKLSVPIIYVNQVGTVDNNTFDGLSTVFNKNGHIFAQAKAFEEQLMIVNPLNDLGKIFSFNTQIIPQEHFTLDYGPDLERTYKTIIQGIKDYFNKTGFKRAVLGLSGGLDSSVCAVLLTDALGAENVLGISMPSKITSQESKTDAQTLATNLGINFTTIPIKDMVDTTTNTLNKLFQETEQAWNNRYKQSYTSDNIQARSRAVILWAISNEFPNCLPIATSDKSEAYMGYATINGDMSGGFAPIADVTKTKLFALARYLNSSRKIKNAIPESVILKKPGAELAIDQKTGKPLNAEDALMPYEFMDEVIWRIENKKENYYDMLNSQFLYEQTNKITKEQKSQWLEKFYQRMAGALYKGSILPPFVCLEYCSMNKYNYAQPISSKINYKGYTKEQIKEIINSWKGN